MGKTFKKQKFEEDAELQSENQNLGQVSANQAGNQKGQVPEGIVEVGKEAKAKQKSICSSHSLASSAYD